MEDIIGFALVIITLVINIVATIISSSTLAYLIWHEWRLRDVNFVLVINTYLPMFICSIIHVFFNIETSLGDTHLFINTDTIVCRVRGYIYLYAVIWLFDSFSAQAYIRMLNILYPRRTFLRSHMSTMIFIVITWFGSLALIIPTIFLQVIAYQPSEYQCLVDLHTWKGNAYMTLGVYSIPITITVTTYVLVVKHMQKSTLRNQQRRKIAIRDVMVLKRIVILVGTLIVLGLPSAIFWIQGLIIGNLHPLAYRVILIFIAVDILILTFAVALTNPQVKRLLPLFNRHHIIHVMPVHLPQQQ